MKKYLSMLIIAATIIFAACDNDIPQPDQDSDNNKEKTDKDKEESGNYDPDDPRNNFVSGAEGFVNLYLDSEETQIVNKLSDFELKLFNGLDENRDDENIFISPLSASLTLSLLANGAEGSTQSQILEALGFEVDDIESLNNLNNRLVTALPKIDITARLSIANSLWFSNRLQVNNNYVEKAREIYNTEVNIADFTSATILNEINNWCSNATNGCIPAIASKIDPKTDFAAFNAIYFYAQWIDKFKKQNTKKDIFKNQNGLKSSINMMHQKMISQYAENEKFQILEVPLGANLFEIIIFLPKDDKNTMIENLDIIKDRKNFALYEVDFYLPKFKINYETNGKLKQALQKTGIIDLFANADLSGICDNILSSFDTQQNTYIKVDEDGIEAAAATASGSLGSGPSSFLPSVVFKVDHPFQFVIQERTSGTILFMGKINNLGNSQFSGL